MSTKMKEEELKQKHLKLTGIASKTRCRNIARKKKKKKEKLLPFKRTKAKEKKPKRKSKEYRTALIQKKKRKIFHHKNNKEYPTRTIKNIMMRRNKRNI